MATSGISFQGVTSGLQTDQLVNAIITQASAPMTAMQNQVAAGKTRSTALTALQSQMDTLSNSLATLSKSGFDARTVTSSDPDNAYVTATATGSVLGSFDLQVGQTALAARLSPTLDGGGNATNLAAASGTASIFAGAEATFAVQGTDGVTKQFTLDAGSNTIYGLAAAINALGSPKPGVPGDKGLGVTATVINTGSGANPYQLVLTASKTGIGAAGANLTLADVTAGGAVNSLGIAAGSVTTAGDGSTSVTGGIQSQLAARNAQFTLNGIQLTRTSNTVTDAVNGVTFQLKQGGQTGTTVLTVGQDTEAATTNLQSVIGAYNALMGTYKADTAKGGPLDGDTTARNLMDTVRRALVSSPAGVASNAVFNSAASLGLTTNQDGTLSLNTTVFQNALKRDPIAAKSVFATVGTSTNPSVSLGAAGPNTSAGVFEFDITSFTAGGALAGTVKAPDGTSYSLTGTNGILAGADGTPLEGLYLNVSGTGAGSLTVSKGVGTLTQDAISSLTAAQTGTIAKIQKSITESAKRLDFQIAIQQIKLDTMKTTLQSKYAAMEATITQLQAIGQSLGSLA